MFLGTHSVLESFSSMASFGACSTTAVLRMLSVCRYSSSSRCAPTLFYSCVPCGMIYHQAPRRHSLTEDPSRHQASQHSFDESVLHATVKVNRQQAEERKFGTETALNLFWTFDRRLCDAPSSTRREARRPDPSFFSPALSPRSPAKIRGDRALFPVQSVFDDARLQSKTVPQAGV